MLSKTAALSEDGGHLETAAPVGHGALSNDRLD